MLSKSKNSPQLDLKQGNPAECDCDLKSQVPLSKNFEVELALAMCSKSLAGLKNYRGWSPRLVTAAYLELPSIEAIVTAGRGGCGTQFWFIVIKSTNSKRSGFLREPIKYDNFK